MMGGINWHKRSIAMAGLWHCFTEMSFLQHCFRALFLQISPVGFSPQWRIGSAFFLSVGGGTTIPQSLTWPVTTIREEQLFLSTGIVGDKPIHHWKSYAGYADRHFSHWYCNNKPVFFLFLLQIPCMAPIGGADCIHHFQHVPLLIQL